MVFIFLLASSAILCVMASWAILEAPNPHNIKKCIETKINKVNLCDKNNDYVNIKLVSPSFIKTLVVSEDASFYFHNGFDFHAPFGGYKKSGNGREWGEHGFEEYLEVKSIVGYDPAK